MIERSERIDQVVELLGANHYGAFVYEPAANDFRTYSEQPAINIFFLPTAPDD
jgi:hypothetical protein